MAKKSFCPSPCSYYPLLFSARVYANDQLIDQLLFRDVKKNERKMFATSVPNMEKETRVISEVLKSSSPAVVVGCAELQLKEK